MTAPTTRRSKWLRDRRHRTGLGLAAGVTGLLGLGIAVVPAAASDSSSPATTAAASTPATTSAGTTPSSDAPTGSTAATTAAATATTLSTETSLPAGDDPCPDELTGPGSEPWIQSELYFSQPSGDADAGTDDLYMQFLADEVTPRFPAGLTMLSGVGQWQGSDGTVGQSRSHVLVILFPADTAAESSALLEEIRDAYETQFDQQSVLRADTAPVCTSF